jgi:hypothetical protein
VPTTFIVTRDDDGKSDSDNEDGWEEVENSEGNTSNSGVVYICKPLVFYLSLLSDTYQVSQLGFPHIIITYYPHMIDN